MHVCRVRYSAYCMCVGVVMCVKRLKVIEKTVCHDHLKLMHVCLMTHVCHVR